MNSLSRVTKPVEEQSLIERLRNRAVIRRELRNRSNRFKNTRDKIADLCDEAANELERLYKIENFWEGAE